MVIVKYVLQVYFKEYQKMDLQVKIGALLEAIT